MQLKSKTQVFPNYSLGLPRVIPDMKLKLQVLCFCITYAIVDYYFGN